VLRVSHDKLTKDRTIEIPLIKKAGLNKRELPKTCTYMLIAQKKEKSS